MLRCFMVQEVVSSIPETQVLTASEHKIMVRARFPRLLESWMCYDGGAGGSSNHLSGDEGMLRICLTVVALLGVLDKH